MSVTLAIREANLAAIVFIVKMFMQKNKIPMQL